MPSASPTTWSERDSLCFVADDAEIANTSAALFIGNQSAVPTRVQAREPLFRRRDPREGSTIPSTGTTGEAIPSAGDEGES
jgi:hypothetical protein